MKLDEALAYGPRMHAAGIGSICMDADGNVTAIAANPHWTPEPTPETAPVFDPNPQANALATREWLEKERARKELERKAEEDRVRFAHTEGV